jgi:hypothetical protein
MLLPIAAARCRILMPPSVSVEEAAECLSEALAAAGGVHPDVVGIFGRAVVVLLDEDGRLPRAHLELLLAEVRRLRRVH